MDYRAGLVASILVNLNRDEKKQPRPWEWMDFFPHWKEPEPEQDEDEMLGMMLSFARSTQRKQLPS